jgi:hypothetical protein
MTTKRIVQEHVMSIAEPSRCIYCGADEDDAYVGGEYCVAREVDVALSKATPRPWHIGEDGDVFVEGFCIATVTGAPGRTPEGIANAALIVQAVNSFDARREALQACLAEYRKREWSDPAGASVNNPARLAEAALAPAKGGTR